MISQLTWLEVAECSKILGITLQLKHNVFVSSVYVNIVDDGDELTVADGALTITLQDGQPKVYTRRPPAPDGAPLTTGLHVLSSIPQQKQKVTIVL